MKPLAARQHSPGLAIAFVVFAMIGISINDMLIKQFSDRYPLHEMIFVRSSIGLVFSLVFLQFEGGFASLKTRHIWLHVLRGLFIVAANMLFFAALASAPLADATALFFVAPLFITLLSIPVLGEKVGVRRLSAVLVGLIGVVIVLRPGVELGEGMPDRWMLLLPILAAFAYSCMQILTRRLGVTSTASAMTVYIQSMFIVVSLGFFVVAGDGRFAEGVTSESGQFLLRAWVWPEPEDLPLLGLLGVLAATIGYTLAAAYRSADAATVAPFEYVVLPMAIFWGWLIFGQVPDVWVFAGSGLIAASGVYVFIREKQRARPLASRRPIRRA